MHLSMLRIVRQQLVEHRVAALVSTAIVGLGIGVGLYFWSVRPPPPRTVPQLIRALQQQDGLYLEAWSIVWAVLPDCVTRRCSSLEPRSATPMRRWAAAELAHRGTNAAPAIPHLVNAFLNDSDPGVSIAAVETLRDLGPLAQVAVPSLLAFFNNEAASTLSGAPHARSSAGAALAAIAPHSPEVPESLLRALQNSEEPGFRSQIIAALGSLKPPPETVVRALINSAESTNALIQEAGVMALGELGPEAAAAVPSLVRSFEQLETAPDPPRGLYTAAILRRYGYTLAPLPAVPPVASPQTNANTLSRAGGVVTAWQLAPTPSSETAGAALSPNIGITYPAGMAGATPFVTTVDPNSVADLAAAERQMLRSSIMETLGRIGPKAQLAIPLLQREATNQARPYAYEAACAQWQIQGDAAAVLPVFAFNLRTNLPVDVRCRVIEYMARVGADALPVLRPLLESGEMAVRSATVRALGRLGSAAHPAFIQLKTLMESDPKNAVRIAAAEALRQIDPVRAKTSIPVTLIASGRPVPNEALPTALRQESPPR